MKNIPPSIADKIGRNLYRESNHPICIVKEMVFDYFKDLAKIEIDNPYVPVEYNFDRLRVPADHPSRSITDTFYKDKDTVLRTHMTCYLYPLGSSNNGKSMLKYITCGDVYRKDAIDATHYPVFHQVDAFCIVPNEIDIKQDLRTKLGGLVKHLFGDKSEYRFLEDTEHKDVYFPFTVNSFEVEVKFETEDGIKQLEILGAGTVHPDIMKDLGLPDHQAWAFGIGLERLAMIMFDIPDIRFFWTKDPRFLEQFQPGKVTKFKPFSKYEKSYKDVSFFVSPEFSYNDLCAIARDADHDSIIESITLIDEFQKNNRTSQCYRISYRSMDGTLKSSDINSLQESIRASLVSKLKVELR